MELPDLVRQVECTHYAGDSHHLFWGNRRRLVPREEATRFLVSSLNSILAYAHDTKILFSDVYFETASISALQHNLDRMMEEEGSLLIRIHFVKCIGAVEMAICVAINSKCQKLSLTQQCLSFTPALADALNRSASLGTLDFSNPPGELVPEVLTLLDMERLALCLCTTSSIQVLCLINSFKGDESMVAFVEHLPGMSNLRSLTLERNEFGDAGERALIDALEGEKQDHSLEELRLVGKPTSLQNYVDFLLWLNRNGGRKAISSSTPMKLIELLAHLDTDDDRDPSAVYFTLCSDPGRFENL
jgi:hypothetical protein